MTEYLGCDYAMRADTALPEFKRRGFSFVARYLPSPGGTWKQITAEEAAAIAAGGLGIVSIWETDPTKPGFFTPARGAQEGALALQAAKALGQPAGTPIYATVDYDVQDGDLVAIDIYMQAFGTALNGRYPVGVYGGYRLIDYFAAQGKKWLWQTYAWSGGRLHPKAILYQFKNTSTIDYDRAFGDPGWWRPDGQPVTAAPAPPMERGGSAVPLSRSGDNGLAVQLLQTLLTVAGHVLAPDGDFGPATLEAVKAFQSENGLTADGLVGPLTWGALAKITPKQADTSALTAQVQQLQADLATANGKLAQVRSVVS